MDAGPEKKFPPLTGFDLLSKTGNAYEERKNDDMKGWQKKAYQVRSLVFSYPCVSGLMKKVSSKHRSYAILLIALVL